MTMLSRVLTGSEPPSQVISLFPDYKPHAGQLALHTSRAKTRVVTAAIRSGKTHGVMHDILLRAANLQQGGVLCVAPNYKMIKEILEEPCTQLAQDSGLFGYRNKQDNILVLKNGCRIYFRSGEKPDSIRGLTIHESYIDEACQNTREVYDVVMGRMITTNGNICLISSPKGRGN